MPLELRPNCERCDRDLPPDARDAFICTFECTFCRQCVEGALEGRCPNCGGGFSPRPVRPAHLLAKHPPSTVRVIGAPDSGRDAIPVAGPADGPVAGPHLAGPHLAGPHLAGPYRRRSVRFLEAALLDGWRVKVYGITLPSPDGVDRPAADMVTTAIAFARDQLPQPPAWTPPADDPTPVSLERYGVAVLIIHKGREGTFVLLTWWVGENMLKHRAFLAPLEPPHVPAELASTEVIACTWELAVLAFERDVWVETVLANPDGPDLDAWFARRLETEV